MEVIDIVQGQIAAFELGIESWLRIDSHDGRDLLHLWERRRMWTVSGNIAEKGGGGG